MIIGVGDVEVACVVPSGVVDEASVVAGRGLNVAEVAVVIVHGATVGDCQRVAKTGGADVEVAGIAPDGTGARDDDRVIVAEVADGASVVEHSAAVGDGQRVAGTDVADNEVSGGVPDGVRAGDRDGVVIAELADVAVGADVHRAAVGNGQRIAGAAGADVEVATVIPDGAGAGDGGGVIAGGGVIPDDSGGIEHGAAVGNDEPVAGAVLADVELAAVVPDGTGAGDEDGVVAAEH